MNVPRLLIADDHQAVAQQLVRLLSGRFEIAGTVHEGSLVFEAATTHRPDIVLLDLSMPHVSGLEVLRQFRRFGVEFKSVVVTMYADATLAVEALKRGASGFVLKSSIGEELLPALDLVLRGETYLARDLRVEIMGLMLVGAHPTNVTLTAQQREVLHLIVRGRRISEIASTLDISTSSVAAIKDNVMRLLGVQSTAELVRYTLEHRLVEASALRDGLFAGQDTP